MYHHDHMYDQPGNHMSHHMGSHMFPNVLHTVQHCEATCEHMITMLIHGKVSHRRSTQIQLLRDCADICTVTAKFIARESGFSRSLAHLCAHICEVCGNECARHPDKASQHCARVCLDCAQECKSFAGQ